MRRNSISVKCELRIADADLKIGLKKHQRLGGFGGGDSSEGYAWIHGAESEIRTPRIATNQLFGPSKQVD